MDPDLGRFQVVWAAAGLPTAVFPVPPGTLRTLANATVAPITESPQPADDGSGPRGSRRVRAGRPPRRRPTDAPERGGVTAPPSGSGSAGPSAGRQPHDATIVYPGGLRARWRWGGSGEGPAVFALSEAGGTLDGPRPLVAGSTFEELCRAELRIDGPAGPWTVRLASPIYDEPAGAALGRRTGCSS